MHKVQRPWMIRGRRGLTIRVALVSLDQQAHSSSLPRTMWLSQSENWNLPLRTDFYSLQHQTSLQEIRENGEKDIESLRGDIAKLERTITVQQQTMQHNMELTNQEFRAVRAEAQTQMQSLTATFQESLQQALLQHDKACAV